MDWKDKVVLITGGTGSFGKKFIKILLAEKQPRKIIIFSRDELKQHEMRVAGFNHPSLRYFIGDVRDLQRQSFYSEKDLATERSKQASAENSDTGTFEYTIVLEPQQLPATHPAATLPASQKTSRP